MLFNTSLVLLLVRARLSGMDRTLVEASYDLFATPWRTFRQITFPQLLPAIVAGFLLSFTFSFDDYVITTFVSGPGSQTLPLYIFGQTRQGVTPLTNAVAAMMLAAHADGAARRPARRSSGRHDAPDGARGRGRRRWPGSSRDRRSGRPRRQRRGDRSCRRPRLGSRLGSGRPASAASSGGLVGALPRQVEVRPAEVAVRRGLAVDRPAQVEGRR